MNCDKLNSVISYCKHHSLYIANFDRYLAQEVVSETLLWIAENKETFDTIEYYKSFFYKFMKNSLMTIKKNKHYKWLVREELKRGEESDNHKLYNIFSYQEGESNTDLYYLNKLLSNPKSYGKYIKSNNKGISHLVYKDWLKGFTTEEIMDEYDISKASVSLNIKKAKEIVNKFFMEEIYSDNRIYRYGFNIPKNECTKKECNNCKN